MCIQKQQGRQCLEGALPLNDSPPLLDIYVESSFVCLFSWSSISCISSNQYYDVFSHVDEFFVQHLFQFTSSYSCLCLFIYEFLIYYLRIRRNLIHSIGLIVSMINYLILFHVWIRIFFCTVRIILSRWSWMLSDSCPCGWKRMKRYGHLLPTYSSIWGLRLLHQTAFFSGAFSTSQEDNWYEFVFSYFFWVPGSIMFVYDFFFCLSGFWYYSKQILFEKDKFRRCGNDEKDEIFTFWPKIWFLSWLFLLINVV